MSDGARGHVVAGACMPAQRHVYLSSYVAPLEDQHTPARFLFLAFASCRAS